ncbi:MAG: hypothetical protein ABIB46_03565 [bacterium]
MKNLIISFLIMFLGLINGAFAEVNINGDYKNYGEEDYEDWVQKANTQVLYDPFGGYLLEGINVLTFGRETPLTTGNILNKAPQYQSFMNHLIIAKDSFGENKIHSRIMFGDEIKTSFTNLTFKKSQFHGFRWDIFNDRNEFTILATNTDKPVRLNNSKSSISREVFFNSREDTPTSSIYSTLESHYLYGVHNVFRLGDIMRLGVTYMNHCNFYSFGKDSNKKNSLYGYDPNPDKIGDLTGQSLIGMDLRGSKWGWNFETELVSNEKFFDGKSFKELKKSSDYVNIDSQGYADVSYAYSEVINSKYEEIYRDKTKGQTYAYFLKGERFFGKNLKIGLEKYYVDPYYLFSFVPVYDTFNSQKSYWQSITDNWGSLKTARRKGFSDYVYVDDNDDNDRYADNVPDALLFIESEGFMLGDKDGVFPGLDKDANNIPDIDENRNGIPDYEEDFLICFQDSPEYEKGNDNNNNEIIDKFENDRNFDYAYSRNRDGLGLISEYLWKDVNFSINIKLEKEKVDLGKHAEYGDYLSFPQKDPCERRNPHIGENNFIEFITSQEKKINFKENIIGKLVWEARLKKVADNIPDDCVEQRRSEIDKKADISSMDSTSPIFVDMGKPGAFRKYFDDMILYEDSLVKTIFAMFEYSGIKGFNFTSKFKWINNDQNKENNTINSIGFLSRFFYKIPLTSIFSSLEKINFCRQIYFKPMGKYIVKNYNWSNENKEYYERTRNMPDLMNFELETTFPTGNKAIGTGDMTKIVNVRSLKKDEYKTIIANLIVYEFSPTLSLVGGVQKRTDIFNINPTDNFTSFLKSVQLINKSQFRGYDIAVTIGYTTEHYDALNISDEWDSEKIFLNIYAGF